MKIEITDDHMYLRTEDASVIATARRRAGGWGEVTHWPRFFDRNQAITALTVTSLLETGYGDDDPFVIALREEVAMTRTHQNHDRLGCGHRRCRHLLPSRLRVGKHARRDRRHGPAVSVHRGWPDPRSNHAHTRRQPATPARTTAGALVPGADILATIGANLAHGLGHGPIGAVVSAWPALALAGYFELLMTLIRRDSQASATFGHPAHVSQPVPIIDADAPPELAAAPAVEQTVLAWYHAGHSQRTIARELNLDRRKVKRIIGPRRMSTSGGMPSNFRHAAASMRACSAYPPHKIKLHNLSYEPAPASDSSPMNDGG